MMDNTTFQSGTLASPPADLVVATDNIAGVNYQRVKVVWGVDGTVNDASATNPLPVDASGQTLTVGTHPVTQASGPWSMNLTQVAGASIAQGHGTAAAAIRVELPTDGTGLVSAAQSGTWNVTNISGTISLPTGAATETTLGTRLSESDFDTKTGSLTETAPATDTASSGLNGRLQRLAQRLTSLLAVFPTTIDTNSGNKSASTLRVVLATDQPALTNKLLVTPDSVALPSNQSVNVSQINAVTPLMGNGITGTGSPRVTIASDNTAFSVNATLAAETTKVIGTVNQGTSPWVANISQINGVTPLMGNGTTGTGSQRVTIASDNTAFSVNATLAAETTKVIGTARIIGNGGATLDSTVGTGTAPTNQVVVGALYNSTEISPTTGQAFALQADSKGRVRQVLMDAAGNTRGANVNASNQLSVSVDNTPNVGTVTTVSTLTGGGVAHDGADSGNPVKIGAKASSTLSDDTMVANGDRTDLTSDVDGTILVRDQFPLADIITERVTDTGGTSTNFTNFSATASTRSVITAIVVYNSSATAGFVDFRDGSAGSVLYTVPLPAGGGAVLPAGATPYFRTSANTALAYDVSGALSTVYISVTGFKSKV